MVGKMESKKVLVLVTLSVSLLFSGFVFSARPSLASNTNGTIDSTYRYAWGENIGWVDFGTSNGNVSVTDAGLSGYALSENAGWIYLGDITNNNGTLSGYAWSENAGWIKFNPTNGGVSINSSGEFTGSALSENFGWIIFSGDYKVKTDYLPATARPACNNRVDDDEDGLIDYTRDPGCDSLEDNDESNVAVAASSGGGGGGSSYGSVPPSLYPTVINNPIVPAVVQEAAKIVPAIINSIVSIFKPAPPPAQPSLAVEELVPKTVPSAFAGKWQLLPRGPIGSFVLAPLPQSLSRLAAQLPQLKNTFNQVGIHRMSDLEKLVGVNLAFPTLTEVVGAAGGDIIPLSALSSNLKSKLPNDVLFIKTGGGLVDFGVSLSLNEEGDPQQEMRTIVGKPMVLTVKPDKGVKSVRGFLVFKSKLAATEYQNKLAVLNGSGDMDGENGSSKSEFMALTLGLLKDSDMQSDSRFGIAPREVAINYGVSAQNSAPAQLAEERLVLQEFTYTDPDGDGIYTAEINAPVVDGEYDIITVMDYEINGRIVSKEITMRTVVDPEGYVYESYGDKQIRVPGAVVSIFRLDDATKKYNLWPAKDFLQENPQVTDVTGKYSFLVPPGNYYISVQTPGYNDYEGKQFEVKEGPGVHFNIELRSKGWWFKVFDWKTGVLLLVVVLLLYNFYRDKIREKLGKSKKYG